MENIVVVWVKLKIDSKNLVNAVCALFSVHDVVWKNNRIPVNQPNSLKMVV